MAELMLMLIIMAVCIVKIYISINIIAAISWQPPLILQLLSPRIFI